MYVPAIVPVQDSVEVCEAPRITLDGLSVHVSPVAGEMFEVRLTVPVNPLIGVTVMVEVVGVPALAAILVGLAVTVKSVAVTVTVTL